MPWFTGQETWRERFSTGSWGQRLWMMTVSRGPCVLAPRDLLETGPGGAEFLGDLKVLFLSAL